MPSSIPYDPSLVLANVVSLDHLNLIEQIAKANSPADAAQSDLNALVSLKRSIDITTQEMLNMGQDITDLAKESQKVGQDMEKAAVNYAKAKLKSEQDKVPLRSKLSMVHDAYESPVDYSSTEIKQMPLAADTLDMDVQYFAFDSNNQSSETQASSISSFVEGHQKGTSTFLWFFTQHESSSSSARSSMQSQISRQYQDHDIQGTLVFSIACTHKLASVLSPLKIDPDKLVKTWNAMYPKDTVNIHDPASIEKAMMGSSDDKNVIRLLSGATFGSSFVGMVHVLNDTTTTSSQEMFTMAESMQTSFQVSNWLETYGGSAGSSSSFSNDAKNMLSQNHVNSHCTVIAQGIIPSIKSNTLETSVKGFTDDGAATMEKLLGARQNAEDSLTSMGSQISQAQQGNQMAQMQGQKMSSVLSAVGDIDKQSNKILDTNSLMTAMDDYIEKAAAGNIGVPINYYLKEITKAEVATLWLKKYFPNKFRINGSSGSGSSSSAGSSGDTSSGDGNS